MKLLTTDQIRAWDAYTIQHEPIKSLDLMERAASALVPYVLDSFKEVFGSNQKPVIAIFCGMGNNGGDGLVLARKLFALDHLVQVYVLKTKDRGTPDFESNLARIHELGIPCTFIQHESDLSGIQHSDCIIEALFGSGLNQALTGLPLQLVMLLNERNAYKMAVDMPAGLPGDIKHWKQQTCFKAHQTFTLQVPKQSLLFDVCATYAGKIEVVPIGLHPAYLEEITSQWFLLEDEGAKTLTSNNYAHKGTKGHALLVAGSYGKAGAAILASKATLRAGCGLLTTYVPKSLYEILQTAFPEAMLETDVEVTEIRNFPSIQGKQAVAVGPGLGTHGATQLALIPWIQKVNTPIVIDADALNVIAQWLQSGKSFTFPQNAILTPHPKEFERLFGSTQSPLERLELASKKAVEHQVVLVLKGAITSICLPNGQVYFYNKANYLMATAGSGDVLTGVILSLLAQGFSSEEAAKKGVCMHGQTGQLLQAKGYKHAIASDLIEQLALL